MSVAKGLLSIVLFDFLNLIHVVQAEPQVFGEEHVGSPINFNVTLSGLTRLTLINSTQFVIGEAHMEAHYWDRRSFLFNSSLVRNETGFEKFTIQGFRGNKLMVSTHRYIRFVPDLADYFELGLYRNLMWDFEWAPAIVLYNSASTPSNFGWTKDTINNQLVIGNGTQYENDVDTKVSIFVKPNPERAPNFSIVASYDTEKDFDFFNVGYIAANGTQILIARVSGKGELNLETSLEEAGETTEVYLHFVSDGGVTGPGVNITNLMIVS